MREGGEHEHTGPVWRDECGGAQGDEHDLRVRVGRLDQRVEQRVAPLSTARQRDGSIPAQVRLGPVHGRIRELSRDIHRDRDPRIAESAHRGSAQPGIGRGEPARVDAGDRFGRSYRFTKGPELALPALDTGAIARHDDFVWAIDQHVGRARPPKQQHDAFAAHQWRRSRGRTLDLEGFGHIARDDLEAGESETTERDLVDPGDRDHVCFHDALVQGARARHLDAAVPLDLGGTGRGDEREREDRENPERAGMHGSSIAVPGPRSARYTAPPAAPRRFEGGHAMPHVKIPPPYQGPTGGEARIDVEGAATVRECIETVEARYPGFAAQVFDGAGKVHSFVTLFINGDEIDRGAIDMPVTPADEVEILAAIAGG